MLVSGKSHIIEDIKLVKAEIFDVTELEKESEKHSKEMEILSGMIESLIDENTRKVQDQTEYAKRYDEIVDRFEKEKELYEKAEEEIEDKKARKKKTEFFIRELKKMDEPIREFDPIIWNLMLDYAEVDNTGKMEFVFRNGIRL